MDATFGGRGGVWYLLLYLYYYCLHYSAGGWLSWGYILNLVYWKSEDCQQNHCMFKHVKKYRRSLYKYNDNIYIYRAIYKNDDG